MMYLLKVFKEDIYINLQSWTLIMYSRVPNNRPPPPRLLIFGFFSNPPAFIPTPSIINFRESQK